VTVLSLAALSACADDEERSSADRARTTSSPGVAKTTSSEETAKRSSSPERVSFECDPADANRQDEPRENVAGINFPAVPRRTCTLPQEGCVAPRSVDFLVPPAPGVDVVRVTRTAIDLAYSLGTDLSKCRPNTLSVGVSVTHSGLPPDVQDYPLSSSIGSLKIKPSRPRGTEDYGPADVLIAASMIEAGFRGEIARVRLPPPEGDHPLSNSEIRRIATRRAACRPDIADRTSCRQGAQNAVSGPVTRGTAADLTRSVRRSLEADSGLKITDLECFNGARCDAAFTTGRYRLKMSYQIRALKSASTCWELTAWRVTRPVPNPENIVAPLPSRGCVYP